jgi:protein-disulfide isomerase
MMRIRAASLLSLFLCVSGTLRAQSSDDLSGRLKSLEEAIRALEQQISQLTTSLRHPNAIGTTEDNSQLRIDNIGLYARGVSHAKIAVIEYSDLECPYCAQFHRQTFDQIDKTYVQTGRVRYGFRHLPIEQIHSSAVRAAEALECAGAQDRFWEYQHRLFLHQKALSHADLIEYAREERLNISKFQPCLLDGQMQPRVRQDLNEAQNLGLTGTPAFLFGKVESNGNIRISHKIVGAQPFQTFQAILDGLLTEAEVARQP